MNCYTVSKGIDTSCLAHSGRTNKELLRLLELEITSLENSQVRLAYALVYGLCGAVVAGQIAYLLVSYIGQ